MTGDPYRSDDSEDVESIATPWIDKLAALAAEHVLTVVRVCVAASVIALLCASSTAWGADGLAWAAGALATISCLFAGGWANESSFPEAEQERARCLLRVTVWSILAAIFIVIALAAIVEASA